MNVDELTHKQLILYDWNQLTALLFSSLIVLSMFFEPIQQRNNSCISKV